MIDVTKLTPAPWIMEARQPGDKRILIEQRHDSWHRFMCEVDCDDCDTETAIANAQFIELSRNAFAGNPEALAWWEANRTKEKQA